MKPKTPPPTPLPPRGPKTSVTTAPRTEGWSTRGSLNLRPSSNAKDSPSCSPVKGVSTVSPPLTKSRAKSVPKELPIACSHDTKRSLFTKKTKSGEGDIGIKFVGSQNGRRLQEFKVVGMPGNRPAVAQFARPRGQRPTMDLICFQEGDVARKKNELQERLDQCDILVKNLEAEVLELKAELDKARNLNIELQSQNNQLSEKFAAAEAKIATLITCNRSDNAGYQNPRFKEIQQLIASNLEHSKVKEVKEVSTSKTSSVDGFPAFGTTDKERRISECSFAPPPPPPPPRPRAKAANSRKASAVVQLYHSLSKLDERKNSPGGGNSNKIAVNSAHHSIVGEIQNRSPHLLAIKSDIETKAEFINGLILKVLAASYTNIEDVVNFMDWLDSELSSLADEQAVLKHFPWPEKKADTMREAATEYRNLKNLEKEVASYKDDPGTPCGIALKKMASLLDKSERSLQRLIKLRNSVILSCKDHKIPIDWMLDSGVASQIKQASMKLAKMYVKRVNTELDSFRYSERESTQEALLLQGVHFAYRAHQFAGGLDSETLCAFEAIKQRVPTNLQGSCELLAGIPSS